MLNSPFLTAYDDDNRYFYSPHTYRQVLGQKAHDEELRRRRAAEVEHRRELLAETLRRRACYEKLARKLQKLKEEETFHAHNLAEQRRRNMASRHQHPEPSYQIMRGPDGRLYRVPIERESEAPTERQNPSAMKATKNLPYSIVRGRDGRLYRVANPGVMNDVESAPEDVIPTENVVPKVSTDVPKPPLQMKDNEDPTPKSKSKESEKTPRRHRVTVIVEDASDSEYEGDELNSVWRNRRPSPGEWMEPVESSQTNEIMQQT
jgi:hypothetical protein